jgi:arsenate reductase-like glutaredoxin family protein
LTVTVYVNPVGPCNTCDRVKQYLELKGITPKVLPLTDEVRSEYDPDKVMLEFPIVVHRGKAHSGFRINELHNIVRDHNERSGP